MVRRGCEGRTWAQPRWEGGAFGGEASESRGEKGPGIVLCARQFPGTSWALSLEKLGFIQVCVLESHHHQPAPRT